MANLQKIIAFIISVVLLTPLVQGFGVTSAYWDTNPLNLHPGEEKIVDLELQNMAGGEDIALLAKVTEGADIAKLLNESDKYLVPFGRKDVMVKVLIKLSPDAVPGETLTVAVSFTQVADESNGEMIQMVSGVGKKIPILVVSDQPVEETQASFLTKVGSSWSTILIVALVILAVALLGFLLLRKRMDSS